jgi:hypothetical protein
LSTGICEAVFQHGPRFSGVKCEQSMSIFASASIMAHFIIELRELQHGGYRVLTLQGVDLKGLK